MHKPLHSTTTDCLRKIIFSEAYHEGDRLPTEPLLAKNLGVSRATLRETLKQLESEDILYRLHGVGTFVKNHNPKIALNLSIPRSITEIIESLGFIPGTASMKVQTELVFPDDVSRLKIEPGSTIVRIERVRTANSQPVAYTIDIVPSWIMKQYPVRNGDENYSLISHLKTYCGIQFAESRSILMPLHNVLNVADKLEIEPSSHILFFEGIDYSVEGYPVILSREYFVPWIFRFNVKRTT
ncbi:MAG: GntR family transcriptional regulator [Candidatus Latescibacterota bacterium]